MKVHDVVGSSPTRGATGDFVVYGLDINNEPVIVSLHRKTLREYTIDHAIKYIGEIPEGY